MTPRQTLASPPVAKFASVVASCFFAWLTVGVVVVGAAFFGLASCGGYTWHKAAFQVAAGGTAILAVALPSRALSDTFRKLAFLLALLVAYFVVEAAASPFYPSTPSSMGEYLSLVFKSLELGPCA